MSLFGRKLSLSSQRSNSDARKHTYSIYESRSVSSTKPLYLIINEENGDLRIKKSLDRAQTNLKHINNIKNINLMIECIEYTETESIRLIIEFTAILNKRKGKYWDILFETEFRRNGVISLINLISSKLHQQKIIITKEKLLRPNEWISDDTVSLCPICNDHFNTVTRRHHCRYCGKVFCQKCSSKTAVLPDIGIRDIVRICDICYKYIILNRMKSNGLLSNEELYAIDSVNDDDHNDDDDDDNDIMDNDEDQCYYGITKDWRKLIAHNELSKNELRALIMSNCGIPSMIRGFIWKEMVCFEDIDMPRENDNNMEEKEIDIASTLSADLDRTFVIHSSYCDRSSVSLLRNVLMRYSERNAEIGYCQSMNFLGGILLLFLNAENAFKMLSYLIERVCCLFDCYYYHQRDILGVKIDGFVFNDLVKEYAPNIYQHLNNNNYNNNIINHLTFHWFLSLFVNTLCLKTLLMIWDIMICLDGIDIIFRCALSILKIKEEEILKCREFHEIHNVLSNKNILNDTKNNKYFMNFMNKYKDIHQFILKRREFHRNKLKDDYIESVLYNPSISINLIKDYKKESHNQWIVCNNANNEKQFIPVFVEEFTSNTPQRSDDDEEEEEEPQFQSQLLISKSFHRDLKHNDHRNTWPLHDDHYNMIIIAQPTQNTLLFDDYIQINNN